MFKNLFLSVIILLTINLTFITESASQSCTAIPICTNDTDQEYAIISEGMIVWKDVRNGTWALYGYDLSVDSDGDGVPNWLDPDRPTPDPAESLIYEVPYSSVGKTDISGKFIVFDYSHQDNGAAGYDLALNKDFLISPSFFGRKDPAICNGIVAWSAPPSGRWCIYAYSLHHDSDDDGIPDIYDSNRPDPTWIGRPLTTTNPYWWAYYPDISEKVAVFEIHGRNKEKSIYGYDIQVDSDNDGIPNWLDSDRPWPDTLAAFKIAPYDRPGQRGAVTTSGKFVVWEEGIIDNTSDLHGYDLSVDSDGDGILNYLDRDRPDPDPAEFVISSAPGKQGGVEGDPNKGPAISGNWVVWIDHRNGNADIYGYDLSVDTDEDGIPNYLDPDRPDPDPAEKPIITYPSNQWTVRGSAISGSVLTWIDDRNGNKDVYACILYPDTSNTDTLISSIHNNMNKPIQFALYQNYPNPFNMETNIKYQLPSDNYVTMKIYNMLGQEIRTLTREQKGAGYYTVHWDGKDNSGSYVTSGIYIYKIKAGNFIQSKRLLICK